MFPVRDRYCVIGPDGLVHVAMAYDDDGFYVVGTLHATWCNIEVSRQWTRCHDNYVVTCLACVSQTPVTA